MCLSFLALLMNIVDLYNFWTDSVKLPPVGLIVR